MKPPERTQSTTHSKGWGSEVWIVNNEEYCGKFLNITKAGFQCSIHFHKNKREHFYVTKGRIKLTLVDTRDGDKIHYILEVGEGMEIPRLQPHRFTALTDNCQILEISTHHEEDDSYRVEPGDSQKQ